MAPPKQMPSAARHSVFPNCGNSGINASNPNKAELLGKLGKHKVSGGCLHIKRLSDVDLPTLKKLIALSAKEKS